MGCETVLSQRVFIGDKLSERASVLSGVPQGTCTGPLLFPLYINDLPDYVPELNKCALFADDVKIFSSDCTNFQYAVDGITEWSKAWQLTIAIEKCFVLHLVTITPRRKYILIMCL